MKLIVGFAFTYPSIIDLSTENFMTGYRIVFDREKLVLGWKKFDYNHLTDRSKAWQPNSGYDIDDTRNSLRKPNSTTVPPAIAAGLDNYSTPKSTKQTVKKQASNASPSYHCYTSLLSCFRFLSILILLL
ncbi:hypothetical protein FEM48_Zijuj08G0084700 [Ziziphus jujuba var. spinosa]|uniref:Uncharacterized protein n=1 Tax=Ziziphus jujuba var. spinosa TaxID=714518 RepID=A0A978UY19_ZIZJJ|nr:hypothetical protein FEM48_Zijuj08G0084700 [Ziziphus jujuba var. spinosa]